MNYNISFKEAKETFFTSVCCQKLTKLQNLKSDIRSTMLDLSFKEKFFGLASIVSMYAGSVFAHEYSHMTAIRTLFTNIDPYIGCDFSEKRCYVEWNGDPIIRPELPITYETARGIVAAAGPISDVTVVALSSIVAWKMRHSNKKISLIFATSAVAIAANTFGYAAKTDGSDVGDFANIELFLGISHNIQTAFTGSIALGACILLGNLFSKALIEASIKKNT